MSRRSKAGNELVLAQGPWALSRHSDTVSSPTKSLLSRNQDFENLTLKFTFYIQNIYTSSSRAFHTRGSKIGLGLTGKANRKCLSLISGINRLDGSIEGIPGSAGISAESGSSQVSHVISVGLVGVVVGLPLLGGSNVDLIVLVLEGGLEDTGEDPGSRAQSGELKEERNAEQDVGDGVVEEGDREGRGGKLPGDRGKDGRDDGSLESVVEEGLGRVGDAEDVLSGSGRDVHGRDGSDEEEGRDDGQLTADHESGEVLSVALEKKLAGLASEEGGTALAGRELGNGEEGNL